ncbi:MAG: bifunctional oligoribonuclease/PAP phosphatase NrnA [Flavobacteriales bacterium]|nr:bifunctional oligoribonuclease/PAP phosphatase NrnA [Flavobacteriales bacterium]
MSVQLKSAEISKARELVAGASKIVITTHKSPDGDAIGSSLALWHLLREAGKQAVVIVPDDIPGFLKWMKGTDGILVHFYAKNKAEELIAQADLVFMLDYNNLNRTGAMEGPLRESKADFILIDHHRQPETFPTLVYSDTSQCSTAQMIYKFMVWMDWKQYLNRDIGACIYCGIMTDSGSFRFPSVTPETHHIVAHLVEEGVDHSYVHRMVHDNNSEDRLRLIGYALGKKMEVLEDCSTAIISLTEDELKRYNQQPGDTEGLVNQALSIGKVNLAAFFRESGGEVRLSLRSKGQFDVNRMARESWNGGGHLNAAGGSTSEPIEEALARFRAQVRSMAEMIKNA